MDEAKLFQCFQDPKFNKLQTQFTLLFLDTHKKPHTSREANRCVNSVKAFYGYLRI